MAATRDLVVQVTADVSGLNSGMAKGAQSLSAMEKQARETERQIKKIGEAGTNFQRLVNDFAGVSQAQTGAARASAEAFQEFSRLQDAVDDLRGSMDPAYAATKRYEAALGTLDDALARGVISADDHAASVKSLDAGMTGATKGAGGFKDAARGMAQQLSQVGQQTMATGDFVQALAIQLPDLGLAFGAVGAAGGLLAGIALPMVVNMFSSTGDAAADTETRLESLQSALDSYSNFADIAAASTDDLRQRFGEFAEQMRSDAQYLMQVDLGQAVAALGDNAAGIGEALDGIAAAHLVAGDAALFFAQTINDVNAGLGSEMDVQNALDQYQTLAGEADAAAQAMGMTVDEALQIRDAINAIDATNGMNGLATTSQAALDAIRQIFPAGAAIPAALAPVVDKIEQIRTKAVAATAAMNGLKNAAPGGDWMNAANQALRDTIGYIQQAKDELAEMPVMTGSGQLVRPSVLYGNMAGRGMPADAQGQVNSAVEGVIDKGKGGSAGGGGADPLTAQVEALRQSLMSQETIQLEAYAREQEQLQAALDAKRISMEQYQAMTEASQAQHHDRMAALDVYRYGSGTEKASAFFGDMASIMEAGGDKTLKISKAFGAAQALVNAWTGASEALKLPFPGNMLAFGKVLATGMGAVNAIKGAGKGGTSGIASAGGGSAASVGSASAAPAQTPLVVSLQGFSATDLFTGAQLGSLFKKLQAEAGGRGLSFA